MSLWNKNQGNKKKPKKSCARSIEFKDLSREVNCLRLCDIEKLQQNLLDQPVHQRSMVSSSVGNAHLKMSVPIWVSPLWLPSIVPPLSPNFFPLMTQPEVTISNSLHINYISFQLLDKLWLPLSCFTIYTFRESLFWFFGTQGLITINIWIATFRLQLFQQ